MTELDLITLDSTKVTIDGAALEGLGAGLRGVCFVRRTRNTRPRAPSGTT